MKEILDKSHYEIFPEIAKIGRKYIRSFKRERSIVREFNLKEQMAPANISILGCKHMV
jgi:hypothetical protein